MAYRAWRPRFFRRRRRNRLPGAIILGVVLLILIALDGRIDPGRIGGQLDELLGGPQIFRPSQGTIAGPVRVIDGDSLHVAGQNVRLYGIDAPEDDQTCRLADGSQWRCGDAATRFMVSLIVDGLAQCEIRDTDRYNRQIAICHSGGQDLNREMVEQGFAVAYRRYSNRYVDAQTAARSARRGIWASEFMEPEQWRRR